jgi:hypothetical protein
MMTVSVKVRESKIHGTGVYAAQDIRKGSVIWMFTPGLDHVMTDYSVNHAEPRVQKFVMDRGYHSLTKPQWVVCCDEAQFLNFPPEDQAANIELGGEQDGENLLLAARDIANGEELLVPPESDADYPRKINK